MRDRDRGGWALDRAPQLLPVPLGGFAPAHRRTPELRRVLQRRVPSLLAAAAVCAAAAGVWLSTLPRSFTVAMDASGVGIDGVRLTPVPSPPAGMRVFTGAASLAVSAPSSTTVRSGAVMTWNGLAATGHCVLDATVGTRIAVCRFALGTSRLTCVDRFDATTRTWRRRYGDGVEVLIAVPRGSQLIPVPFPLGR